MRREYVAYAALLAMIMLLFTGCDALIGNAFKEANLGQPTAAALQNENTTSLVEQSGITSGSVSDTFIQTVIGDDTTKNAVLATLQGTVNTGTSEEAQAAQALILDIKLADIGADQVVNNITESAGSVINQISGGGADYASIITALLPDSSDLKDIIDNLSTLTTEYDTLAQNIQTNGSTLDQNVVANVAQTALLAEIISDSTPSGSYGSIGEAAAALVATISSGTDPSTITIGDYFATGPDMSTLTADGSTLNILFNAAGMGDLLTQLSSIGS